MKNINIKILPSVVTLGNLFCGFLAIAYVADGRLTAAAWLIFAGMVFDMLDGKVARLTKGCSDFGMQLDSLADMISFGVAPAFIVKVHVLQDPAPCPSRIVWAGCLLFVICAALRLARFNVETDHDESSHLYFKGLATPAGAGVLASMVLLSDPLTMIIPAFIYKICVLAVTVIVGALMVSHVRYLHVGVHFLKKRRPITDLVALVFFSALVVVEPKIFMVALTGGFIFYAFFSPFREVLRVVVHPQNKVEDAIYQDVLPVAD